MFRLKALFGDMLKARELNNQVAEVYTSIAVMNRMTGLGMPDTVTIC
jgi:hypothetical protein